MNAAIGATAAAGEVPMVPVSSLPGGMKTIEALVVPAVCAEVLSTMPEARRPGAFGSPYSESDEEYVSWLSGAIGAGALSGGVVRLLHGVLTAATALWGREWPESADGEPGLVELVVQAHRALEASAVAGEGEGRA